MKKPICVVFLGAILSVSSGLMSFDSFNELVAPTCFNRTRASQLSYPHSMVMFLDLIQLVEETHWPMDAADLAALLLKRFSIDFVEHQRFPGGDRFVVNTGKERKSAVFEAMLKSIPPLEFNDGGMSDEQKCALFSMLSHAVNSGSEKRGRALHHSIEEQGVVSIGADSVLAVSMGHVLRGIVASKYAVRDSAENLLKSLKLYSGSNYLAQGHSVVDHIYGPTLAGVLGTASSWSNTKIPVLGRSGEWSVPVCPAEYRIPDKPGKVTDAELMGALDGFLLGMTLNRMTKNRSLKLSQLLGMYYSHRGVRELLPEFSSIGFSFCTRKEAYAKLLSPDRLQEQVVVMARLYAALEDVSLKESTIKAAVTPMITDFHSKMESLLKVPGWCIEESRTKLPICSTPSDVLIVLDPSPGNSLYDGYQKKLAAYLSENLLQRSSDSRVSITAGALSEDMRQLKLLYTSKKGRYSSPACTVAGSNARGCNQCNEVDLWRAVNGSWNALNLQRRIMSQLTPSKVVVYFKYSIFRNSDRDIHSVIKEMRKNHQDLFIFAVGPKAALLEKFRYNPKDAVVIIPNTADERLIREIARELSGEICQAPAILHCQECERTSRGKISGSYEVFLYPLASQHWVIYPKDFNDVPKSINITFQPSHLPIRVCQEQQNATAERIPMREGICQETGGIVKTVELEFPNICSGRRPSSCDSLHFSVTALPRRPGDTFKECTEPGCQFPDQTKITATYEANFASPKSIQSSPAEQSADGMFLDDPSAFRELVYSKCYNHTEDGRRLVLGQRIPLGNTMDNFIDLLEKVERFNPGKDMFDIAGLLLKRFSVDNFIPQDSIMFFPRSSERKRLLYEMLFPFSSFPEAKFDESWLTESEKCSLFYMLSHTLSNRTSSNSFEMAYVASEQGVVNVDADERIALSLNKVLHGIVAAKSAMFRNITDVLKTLDPMRDLTGIPPEESINTGFAATLGDVLSITAVNGMSTEDRIKIGPEGKWNSSTCSTDYTIRGKVLYWSTYGKTRGAIDGFILGQHAKKIADHGISLSSLLRLYYGRTGVPESLSSVPKLSMCSRRDALYPFLLNDHLDGEVMSYSKAYAKLVNVPIVEQVLRTVVRRTMKEFRRRLRLDLLRNPEFCDTYPAVPEQPLCQTPGETFVILDTDIAQNSTFLLQQRKILGYAANFAHLQRDTRTITIYTNKRDLSGALQYELFNSSSAGCVGCTAAFLDFSEYASDDEASVLDALDRGFTEARRSLDDVDFSPGKTVVYFKYGNIRADDFKLKSVLPKLKKTNNDFISVLVGNNANSLSKLLRNGLSDNFVVTDFVKDDASARAAGKRIANYMCRSPATIHCPECKREINSDQITHTYEGSVAENSIVYLKMEPEDFANFQNGEITMRSLNGIVKICRQRVRFLILPFNDEGCDTIFENVVDFTPTCKGNTCDPIYFAVIGVSEKCRGFPCKMTGKVRYEIKYEERKIAHIPGFTLPLEEDEKTL